MSNVKLRGAARSFIAQRPATEGSGLDRSVRQQCHGPSDPPPAALFQANTE